VPGLNSASSIRSMSRIASAAPTIRTARPMIAASPITKAGGRPPSAQSLAMISGPIPAGSPMVSATGAFGRREWARVIAGLKADVRRLGQFDEGSIQHLVMMGNDALRRQDLVVEGGMRIGGQHHLVTQGLGGAAGCIDTELRL